MPRFWSAATIAAMQAIGPPSDDSPSEDDVAEVAGYASTDDGGGGTFFFETTHIVDASVSSIDIKAVAQDPASLSPAAIVITIAEDTLFVDGQAVLVEGVGGSPNANGSWLVDRLRIEVKDEVGDKKVVIVPNRFVLLGSGREGPFSPGDMSTATVTSLTVTTSGPHRLAPGGRAIIGQVAGLEGSLNRTWMNIGVGGTPDSFTLSHAPVGSYDGGGVVGDGGLSFPSTAVDGRWVRRRDDTELNVKWFGAGGRGDTKDDDTEPLLATIRATRTLKTRVYIPGGDFRVTREMKLETSNSFTDLGLSIRGEGSELSVHGGTQLRAATGMRSILSVDAVNVAVEGVRLACAGLADHGLYLQGAAKLHLDDVHVINALKDGCRTVATTDGGGHANNDAIYARELNATTCGTMYCSPALAKRYTDHLRAVIPADGTISHFERNPDPRLAESGTIVGSGTRFKSIPARAGDFILVGAQDVPTLLRFEIAQVLEEDRLSVSLVASIGPMVFDLGGQPFAIGVGDGWSDELPVDSAGRPNYQNDCSRGRMDSGNFTSCAGAGIASRATYGPLLEHQEFNGCGFAGIIVGSCSLATGLGFNTRISNPYFEKTPFLGGCIVVAQARGIAIDQPMWFGHPRHRRLVIAEIPNANSGVIGYLADYPPLPSTETGDAGLSPIGDSTRIDIKAVQGKDFTNSGQFMLPSSGSFSMDSSPWTRPIHIGDRNQNVNVDSSFGRPVDVTAEPTFPPGADGQELAVCNIGTQPVTFHDGRRTLQTTLVLDCEPGGTVSVGPGQIMMLHFSAHGSMNLRWTQRGAMTRTGNAPIL
jgi:hypothetical protein